ncbi:tight adherence protein F [Actinobacillus equuli]|nr:tight adherence protein F [Actinobacillus equuli]
MGEDPASGNVAVTIEHHKFDGIKPQQTVSSFSDVRPNKTLP